MVVVVAIRIARIGTGIQDKIAQADRHDANGWMDVCMDGWIFGHVNASIRVKSMNANTALYETPTWRDSSFLFPCNYPAKLKLR